MKIKDNKSTVHLVGELEKKPTIVNFSKSKSRPRVNLYANYLSEKLNSPVQILDVTRIVWNVNKYSSSGVTLCINSDSLNNYKSSGVLAQVSLDVSSEYQLYEDNQDFQHLISELLSNEQHIYLLKYQNKHVFDFENNPLVHTVAPQNKVVELYDSKGYQRETFKKLGVRNVPYEIVHSIEELLKFSKKYDNNVFVSKFRGSSGRGNYIANGVDQIINGIDKFVQDHKKSSDSDSNVFDEGILVSKNMEYIYSPSIGVMVDGEQTLVFSMSEQLLRNGTQFNGNIWPLHDEILETPDVINEMIEHAKIIGDQMAKDGYRGVFNIDEIIVNENGVLKPYFIEVNPRHFGHYPQICYTMERLIPWVNISYLDLMIHQGKKFSEMPGLSIKTIEDRMCRYPHHSNFSWIYKRYKNPNDDIIFDGDIPNLDLGEIFRQEKMATYDHPGPGVLLPANTPAFHLVSTGKNRKEAEKRISNDNYFNSIFEKYKLE